MLAQMFDMGTYGVYIWSAYGFSVAVLLFNVYRVIRRYKKVIKNETAS